MMTTFSINGQSYSVDLSSLPGDITLNTFIRDHAGLSATKFMCQEGGCGVCICVVTRKDPVSGELKTRAVNSCLTLLNTCIDSEITTNEGIGNKRNGYHPIQQRLAKMNGTQCGYCSPGFVMNMYGLLKDHKGKVTMETVENSFGGNICRCTGYRPILDAMKSFATDSNIEIPEECRDIEDLSKSMCPKTGLACECPFKSSAKTRASLTCHNGEQWFWPKSLDDLSAILSNLKDGSYMLVSGNTAHGVYRRSKQINKFIDVNAITALHHNNIAKDGIMLGANTSLSDAMDIFRKASGKTGFEYCAKLWTHFDLIANVPVRNMGTLAGNLSIKHQHPDFPSDVYIAFEAIDVQVIVHVAAGQQKVMSLAEYLRTNMNKKVLKSFILRPYKKGEYIFDSYKIMPRAQNAHAYVNAAFMIQIQKPGNMVKSARICYGGLRKEFSHASHLEQYLVNKDLFHADSVQGAFSVLLKELSATAVLPEPSPKYRTKLAKGLFYKFLLANAPSGQVAGQFLSGGVVLKRPLSSGQQVFEVNEGSHPVKKPTEKHEGILQCSGEAMFANDLPPQSQQLWAAFITATKIGATVASMDSSEALKLPGVVDVLTAKDIRGSNRVGVVDNMFFVEDQSLFLEGEVKYYGQPVAVLVAESNSLANKAAAMVKLTYKGGADKVFPTMWDVFNGGPSDRILHINKSDTSNAGTSAESLSEPFDVTIRGILDMGLQYHFFMEPQSTVAIPTEGGMQLYIATQWMDLAQNMIAQLLALHSNEVQVKTPRIGGGYGGKATGCLPAACAAALAAFKLNRPVRFVQSIESMMDSLGKRWACHVDYNLHAKDSGKIVKLNLSFYEDAGCTRNESPLGHTVLLSKNCYQFTTENYILDGYMVITDSPSNTACRGPGSVEAIAMIENVMEHTAFQLGLDPFDVRIANVIAGHKISEMIPRFLESTQYKERRQNVVEFNKINRWTKRGLGLAIMEYHIGYFGLFPATVAIYHSDGTVVISHGGVEMGQGMNTKIAQVAAHDLGIPLSMIRVEGSNTVNGANSMVTGGSIGSEALCFAVRKCCKTLLDRMAPAKEELKDPSWQDLINKAHSDNINLIANDGCNPGEMDPYTICGMALTEVEVDVLTGNYMVTRVDILQDAGESLNPNTDIGQVEGAFIMGLGYWTSEQCVTDKATGQLKTNRTWTYKPPGAKDIPIDFRIELLAQSPNPAGFMGSKATGEPSICLAVNVSFALQQAIQSARDDAGLQRQWVNLNAPMTPEHILLNCGTEVEMMKLTAEA